MRNCKINKRTCLALNWPKLAWYKAMWNVYTLHNVCCTAHLYWFFVVFYLHNVHIKEVLLLYLTNLFYRYTKNRAHKCRNTRTNSLWKYFSAYLWRETPVVETLGLPIYSADGFRDGDKDLSLIPFSFIIFGD